MLLEKVESPTEDKPAPVHELKKSESRRNSEDKTARKKSSNSNGARKSSSDIRTKKISTGEGQRFLNK